jgi:hypothetical protein
VLSRAGVLLSRAGVLLSRAGVLLSRAGVLLSRAGVVMTKTLSHVGIGMSQMIRICIYIDAHPGTEILSFGLLGFSVSQVSMVTSVL